MIHWKGAKILQNGVLYPMHDGTLWFFDGEKVEELKPWKDVKLPKGK